MKNTSIQHVRQFSDVLSLSINFVTLFITKLTSVSECIDF